MHSTRYGQSRVGERPRIRYKLCLHVRQSAIKSGNLQLEHQPNSEPVPVYVTSKEIAHLESRKLGENKEQANFWCATEINFKNAIVVFCNLHKHDTT